LFEDGMMLDDLEERFIGKALLVIADGSWRIYSVRMVVWPDALCGRPSTPGMHL
jgi:hypothetical protein